MKKLINLFVVVLVLCLCLVLGGCGKKDDNTIVVGTMVTPGEPILKFIEEKYEAKGYKLEWETYNSFEFVNPALSEGTVDVNLFQHEPYLNNYNAANNEDLKVAAKLYDCVYGGYTKKNINSLDEMPEGAKIAVAQDASNLSRCLYILDDAGVIELREGIEGLATIEDIANDNGYEIVTMSTNFIASALDDSDVYLGVVNATFAIAAGLTSDQLLCQEADPEHVNANILACRAEDINEQWLIDLVEVLTSDETAEFIRNEFKGTIIPYFVSYVGKEEK